MKQMIKQQIDTSVRNEIMPCAKKQYIQYFGVGITVGTHVQDFAFILQLCTHHGYHSKHEEKYFHNSSNNHGSKRSIKFNSST